MLVALASAGPRSGSAAEPPLQPPPGNDRVQYVGPDTYLLLDSAGRPQPVLGMSYEEFMAAWKQSQRIAAPIAEPRYTIDELELAGRVVEGHAELDVSIHVRLLTDSPVEIPLGMATAILREQPRQDAAETAAAADQTSPGCYLSFQPERGGFVAHFMAQPADRRRLALRILVPLRREANETMLSLNLPRSLVSKLVLETPTAAVNPVAGEGSLVSHDALEQGGSRLTVRGVTGDFRLAWTTATDERPELATVLSATTAIAISIDGHSVRSDARLTVRSYGGRFDRFRVRLPPGAQLVQGESVDPRRMSEEGSPAVATIPTTDLSPSVPGGRPANYRLTVEGGESGEASPPAVRADACEVVVVQLPSRQAGPVDVELTTEQPLGLADADAAIELAGFEVLGAVRQYGDVAIRLADDWQLQCRAGPNVRQVERSELPAPLAEIHPTVAFQFDRQPWSLRARTSQRPLRVLATPNYDLELGPDEARLRVGVAYQLPGARAFEFRVLLRGWELAADSIESDGLVDRDRVLVTRDGVLVLPLVQASTHRADVACVLRRDLSRDTRQFELPLPTPDADVVATGELTVRAATGIECRYDAALSRGLAPLPVTDSEPPPVAEDRTPAARYRVLQTDAVFAAQRLMLVAEVDASMATQLSFDSHRIVADQSIDYWVRNQPLEQLELDVPEGWTLVDEQVQIAPCAVAPSGHGAGESLTVSDVQSIDGARDAAAGSAAGRPMLVPLPQPRLGRFRARLRMERTWPGGSLTPGPVELALAAPTDGHTQSHRVSISTPPEWDVALDSASDDSAWHAVTGPAAGRLHGPLDLSADGRETTLPLIVRPVDASRLHPASVERVWLQTWQTGGTIQERAAFRFHTVGSSVVVELPPGAPAEEAEVLVDGSLADVSSRSQGRVTVDLTSASNVVSAASSPVARTLELRYRRPGHAGWLSRQHLTPPQLVGTATLATVYWQIVLPSGVHVVRPPDQLAAVDRWQWSSVFWRRQPTLTQSELAEWVGATTDQPAPSASQSQYVYSGFAPISSIDVATAARWLVVLAASGIVLVAASLWMYLPPIRRRWIGVGLAVVVAALALSFPVQAALLGQASILGWLLAVLAVILRRWLLRPVERPSLTAGSTQLRLRALARSDSYPTPPAGSSASAIPAVPVAVPDPEI